MWNNLGMFFKMFHVEQLEHTLKGSGIMEKVKVTITCALSSIYILVNNLFGVFTPLVLVTTIAMLTDLLTRLYAVSMRDDEKLESKKVLQGLAKKLGLCLLICITLTMDAGLMIIADTLNFELSVHTVFTGFTLAWILVRELISNLENLAYAGVALPQFVVKALNTAKDKIDSNAEKGGAKNADTTKTFNEESIQQTWCENGASKEYSCPLGGQCEYYSDKQ